MGRVIFLNNFSRDFFSGGIKTTYRHAAILNEKGIEASILQPGGPPILLKDPVQRALAYDDISIMSDDVVVFPETITGPFEKAISEEIPCIKVIFCQNPFYFYSYHITEERLKEWKIRRIIVPSQWAKDSIQSVIGFEDVKVVTPVIDTDVFHPRPKILKIVSASWKWNNHPVIPSYNDLIRKILSAKYPNLADIPWVELSGYEEEKVAEIMGDSAIALILGAAESLGMTALEAMACECVLVGFHGGGGQDFATSQNGFWLSPEDIEGVVDFLALAIEGQKHNLEYIQKICCNARLTAQRYNNGRTSASLLEAYQDLLLQGHYVTYL